ncbi:MAG: tetratricopeptide repeat protein [Acidobacteriaceae bacterium]|nr:tetratricopeptide repeat protein [Acidobacteriaceae bacterium]
MFAPCFLAAFSLLAQQADSQQTGLQALDHQDYSQAEQVFSKLVEANPKDYASLFYLALAETGLKREADAIAHYKQVLDLKPGLYEAELNLGILDVHNEHPADAIPLLRDAAKQKPNQGRPERYLGDALLATGDLSGAEEAYKAAIGADPKLAAAELGLGQALLRQGKFSDALPHYQQAATLDSALKSYLLEIALALSKANRIDDSIALLQEFPTDPGAREELGRLYLASNRPANAVTQFEAAVILSPTAANQLALATAYLRNNQPDAAAPILERALASNPKDYDLRMAVGRIYRDKHQYQEAAAQFLAAAQIKPDSVEAWNEAVNPLVLTNQYSQALAALDKVHNLNADTAGDFYYRAMVLDKLHEVKPALGAYQKFLAMSDGKYPDQEFIARQRSKILEREASR